MDLKEKKTSDKSDGKRILYSKKLRDIKMEVGGDTTALLGGMQGSGAGDKRHLLLEMKQTSLGEHIKKFQSVDISESEIIYVKKRPDISTLIEVKDFSELKKIGKAFKFINCYERDRKVIYFVGGYFYEMDRR